MSTTVLRVQELLQQTERIRRSLFHTIDDTISQVPNSRFRSIHIKNRQRVRDATEA